MTALLVLLLSIVTFLGARLVFMALSKKRIATALSRLVINKKVNRLTLLVYRTVDVFPDVFDLNIRLVYAPAMHLCLRKTFSNKGRN